jgi:hypothetical protein
MSVIAILLLYVIIIKYKIPKRPDQNIRFYLYLASFSLLLFIFLIRFSLSPLSLSCSLHLPHQVLSLSSFSLLLFIFLIKFSLSLSLSLLGCQGHLPLVDRRQWRSHLKPWLGYSPVKVFSFFFFFFYLYFFILK